MKEARMLLEAREKQLIQLRKEKENALIGAPEGTLRICSHGNRTQFYHRQNPQDHNGIYLRAEDNDIARQLAQKEYDQKILQTIDKEIRVVQRYLDTYPKINAEEVYGKLHKERQKLIVPITENEAEYVRKWESVPYYGLGFDENDSGFYTMKGERVRSKSEMIIADMLNREGIPYRYEYPIYLKGIGQVYPDFTVLNVSKRTEFHWEHLGMMDDPAYAEKSLQKIAVYEQNGIFPGDKLILTHETRKCPLNQKLVGNIIQHYLR